MTPEQILIIPDYVGIFIFFLVTALVVISPDFNEGRNK